MGMAASGSLLYGSFVSGLYKYDGTTWTQLSALKPTKMVASGSLLYADFASPYGVYMYDGANWSPLTTSSPQDMIVQVNPNIISDGRHNAAIGIKAFNSNTSGYNNTASGYGALPNNTGSSNTTSGAAALCANTTGQWNTAVGYYALYNSTGNGNTALGQNAGYTGNSGQSCSGSDNIYIGHDVSPGSLTESGTIRIGNIHQKSIQLNSFDML
jgi:hypothetical protein